MDSFAFRWPGVPPATLTIEPYTLELRAAFGTSHSSTTQRCNALFTFRTSGEVVGYGEVGLPPKKAAVYHADLADVYRFVSALAAGAGGYDNKALANAASAIEERFGDGGAGGGGGGGGGGATPSVFAYALATLDGCALRAAEPAMCRAAGSGIEVAIMDAWARGRALALHELLRVPHPCWDPAATARGGEIGEIGGENPLGSCCCPRPSFCTASLNSDVGEMVRQAALALTYSPLLKIKLDSDVEKGERVLEALRAHLLVEDGEGRWMIRQQPADAGDGGGEGGGGPARVQPSGGVRWCIDANASWTPDVAIAYLRVIQRLFPTSAARPEQLLFMVEQPFPADLLPVLAAAEERAGFCGAHDADPRYDAAAWAAVRARYARAGVLLYADESMHTAADVRALAGGGAGGGGAGGGGVDRLVDGVNVKMEKAGGLRGMVAAATAATQAGLRVWLGIMVGSSLNCNATAQCLGLAGECDLDGDLLVEPRSQRFEGGFAWGDAADGGAWGRVLVAAAGAQQTHGVGVVPKAAAAADTAAAAAAAAVGGGGVGMTTAGAAGEEA
jgi:L-alanine-DL-glutamate epimerase-like enolase superfamily enzyme